VPRTSLNTSISHILLHACCRVPFAFTFSRYFTFTYCSKIIIILTCYYTLLHLHTAPKSVCSCLRFSCTTSPSHKTCASFIFPSPCFTLFYFTLFYTLFYTLLYVQVFHVCLCSQRQKGHQAARCGMHRKR
jgi:hypothetical protein